MYLQSINIGTRKTIQIGPKSSETGIYKTDLESAAFRIGDRLRIVAKSCWK